MGANVGVGDLVDGKYRINRVIGEGGWGIVFEGENVRTLKRVAIKILRTQATVTADILQRFEREAQAAGRIGSEHIVEVFDLGSLSDGTHYMVMELLSGESLAKRLEAGPLDPTVTAKLVVQLLDGLTAAHDAGILHRDLKPENLFLVPTRSGEEFVKILDFGISKFNNAPGNVSATMTGAVLGSPCYMAPEQARGLKQVDARTDIYSVGTLLFESVTGRVPFEGENFNDLMFKIVLAPRPNPLDLRPDLDPDLAAIIVKAIAADPKQRFQSSPEFRTALVDWLDSKGIASVRPPELRRGLKTTPRTSITGGAPRPVTGGTSKPPHATVKTTSKPPHWGDATVGVESLSGTPLASSSTLDGAGRSRGRRRVVAAAVGAAALLLVAGTLVVNRSQHSAEAAAGGSPAAVTVAAGAAPRALPPATGAPAPAGGPAPAVAKLDPRPDPTPSADDDTVAGQGAHRLQTPSVSARVAPSKNGHAVTNAQPAPADASKPVASAQPTLPPATPPTTAATAGAPAAPVSTVEGREIRTGL